MRKFTLLVFTAVLIIGSGAIIYGTLESSSLSQGSESFHALGNGKYVSSEFHLNQTYVLSVLGSGIYLIPASEIGEVNSTNVFSIGLMPTTVLNLTNNTEMIYSHVPGGNYFLIYFGNSPPTAIYSIQTDPDLSNILSVVIIAGIALIMGDAIFLALSFMIDRKGKE